MIIKAFAGKKKISIDIPNLPLPVKTIDVVRVNDKEVLSWKSHQKIQWAPQPGYSWGSIEFELWHVASLGGWVAPTLEIRKSTRSDLQRRTYGMVVAPGDHRNGGLVRVGMGPHIGARITIRVRKARLDFLQPLLDEINNGLSGASQKRDQISTRRIRNRFSY